MSHSIPSGSQPGGEDQEQSSGGPYRQAEEPPRYPGGTEQPQYPGAAEQPYPGSSGGSEQPYGQAPYGSYGSYGAVGRPTNTMAVLTLVAGIVGLTIIPFLGSIAAVIMGPIARRELERTGEEGAGMVTAGIIMGWIGIAIGGLFLLLAVGGVILALGLAASFTGAG